MSQNGSHKWVHPHLAHLSAQERYDFLAESGDVDAYAVLDLATSRADGDLALVLEELDRRGWVLARKILSPGTAKLLKELRTLVFNEKQAE
jgi:hypothetical protein